MKEPRLHAGVAVHPQRVIVLPGDVKPRGQPHDRGGAIRLALIARGFVGRRVPRIRDLARSGLSWARAGNRLCAA